ncbi:MAG: DegV family EDD domain-containing protein, partial [Treponema sp.]|nr:DegV family EDD domain-containing protein [Treponema sp.]
VRYHAILLDHLMPEMDGITCLHEIRRQPGGLNRNTPAIVLTANAGHKDQLLYEREGFDGYLTKPVSGSQLEKELLSVLPEDLVTLHGDGANIMNIRDVGSTRRLSSKKKPIIITTDFECDLPAQQLRNLGIPVISGKIITDEGTFRSDIEIDTDAVLAYMEEPGHILKTEEPTVAEYEEFFARQLQDYQYIIHISMSSHVGVSFNHAMEASKSFDNITVVDSGLVSSGMGLMVLNARQFSKETMSPQLVLKKIEESKSLFSTSFVVESLDYLESNGIISHLAKSLCRSLLMHPVVKFHKGYMKVARMEFGEVEKARSKYIRACLSNPSRIDDSILYITYSGLSFQELESIKAQALKLVPFKQVHIQKTAPSVACNCGPGAFGLLFKKKGL